MLRTSGCSASAATSPKSTTTQLLLLLLLAAAGSGGGSLPLLASGLQFKAEAPDVGFRAHQLHGASVAAHEQRLHGLATMGMMLAAVGPVALHYDFAGVGVAAALAANPQGLAVVAGATALALPTLAFAR